MAHTLPDFSTKYRLSTLFGNIDDAELAARLGSASIYHRSGNVYFIDDFSGPTLQWHDYATGGVQGAWLSCGRKYTGDKCCLIRTGDNNNDYASIRRWFPCPTDTKMGIEIGWAPTTEHYNLMVSLVIFDGSNVWDPYVRYYSSNGNWYYNNSAGTEVKFIDGATVEAEEYMQNHMKLTWDLDTKEYLRFHFNEQTYSLAGLGVENSSSSTKPIMRATIRVGYESGAAQSVYLDRVILTQNEH